MENKNLEKAMDIVSALMMGEAVSQKGDNAMLYNEYSHNSQVYDMTMEIFKKLDINLYEYNEALFISAGSNNRVFGYSNEELKRVMGLRLNKELFLVYFIMYTIITEFYKDSSAATYLEYVRIEDVIRSVGASLDRLVNHMEAFEGEETEEESFKALALLWDELPVISADDKNDIRAAKNSRSGYVKLTFNFLMTQNIFTEVQERYYPTDRFRAIAENYFENNAGRLHKIINGTQEENNATD